MATETTHAIETIFTEVRRYPAPPEFATDESECPCEPMDSEDLLYLLYTSGTTAKPKGIEHTTAGYSSRATGRESTRTATSGFSAASTT